MRVSKTMKNQCVVCGKHIRKQSEQRYQDKGNYCESCSGQANVLHKIKPYNPREHFMKGKIQEEIEILQKELDWRGKKLNCELTEEETNEVVSKMRAIHEQIQELRKSI